MLEVQVGEGGLTGEQAVRLFRDVAAQGQLVKAGVSPLSPTGEL